MADGEFKLFREKNVEAIESPESLTDYLRVTSPKVWLLLGAVIILLLGFVVWSIVGRIDTSVRVSIISDGTDSVCYIPASAIESAVERQCITIDGNTYTLRLADIEPEAVTESTNIVARLTGGFEYGDLIYKVAVDAELEAGNYAGRLQTESLKPISLLLN